MLAIEVLLDALLLSLLATLELGLVVEVVLVLPMLHWLSNWLSASAVPTELTIMSLPFKRKIDFFRTGVFTLLNLYTCAHARNYFVLLWCYQ
jgi:hypothetical protein